MNAAGVEIIKVMVVDCNSLYTSTLKILLKNFNIDVVAQAESEVVMLNMLKEHQPDILLYDLFTGNEHFQTTVNEIHDIAPLTKVLVISYETDSGLIDYCLSNGINGFCDKNLPDIDTLAHIIHRIQLGETVIQIRAAA